MDTATELHGSKRLARDLDAVALLIGHRAGATRRLHRVLGTSAADELVASLRAGLRPRATLPTS
jgi:hypothetical protein